MYKNGVEVIFGVLGTSLLFFAVFGMACMVKTCSSDDIYAKGIVKQVYYDTTQIPHSRLEIRTNSGLPIDSVEWTGNFGSIGDTVVVVNRGGDGSSWLPL